MSAPLVGADGIGHHVQVDAGGQHICLPDCAGWHPVVIVAEFDERDCPTAGIEMLRVLKDLLPRAKNVHAARADVAGRILAEFEGK